MKRRSFIQSAALGTAAISAVPLSSCQNGGQKDYTDPTFTDEFDLLEITVSELQKRMSEGTYTARKITEMYLKRIESAPQFQHVELARQGPGVAEPVRCRHHTAVTPREHAVFLYDPARVGHRFLPVAVRDDAGSGSTRCYQTPPGL